MADIHEFAYRFAYETLYEVHIFKKFFGGISETVVIIAAVDEILREKMNSALLFKFFH